MTAAEPPRRSELAAHHRVGRGSRVVLLHGFTQTARSWGPLLERLPDLDAIGIDAPGHGDSSAVATDVSGTADLVARRIEPSVAIGYSMGGRIAIDLALRHPDVVRGLVVISGTAGLRTETERSERRDRDHALAARIEAIGVERFVDEWLAQDLFTTLPPALANRSDRLRNTDAGLASSLRLCGVGSQTSHWDGLGTLACPVLLITGSLDTKFCAIARDMAQAIGANATTKVIDGAGHTAHLEKPDEVATAISEWLADQRL